jgi:hypothetical protein
MLNSQAGSYAKNHKKYYSLFPEEPAFYRVCYGCINRMGRYRIQEYSH